MEPQADAALDFGAQERYRLLVDAVEEYAIFMLDPRGVVVSWNSGAQRLKGYTEQEIVGRHFSAFYSHDDVRAGLPDGALMASLRDGRYETEGWRYRKSGKRFWAQVVIHPIRSPHGVHLGFAKVTRDLTKQRAAEESLRRSEEQLRLLFQAVTDYAIYRLDPTGSIASWNVGAQRIKGYAPEEVIGTNFARFYRTADQACGLPSAALATAAKVGRFESEGWRVRKDGSEFWASAVIDAIFDSQGELIGFAKVTRDITEKRRAQYDLEQAREALFQAQKLDAIGQLTGGVAHDFNNLLMVILSSLELLRRRLPEDEKMHSLLQNAVQGARRGAALTQRMLSFARKQNLRPVAVDVSTLIEGMTGLLSSTLGSRIQLVSTIPFTLGRVLVDPNQLELAILNLAVNARDAMPNGGELRLNGEERDGSETVGLQPGAYVCISMVDSGAGMDAATLARAREPFFTTKGVGKGTGLGLPMVEGLAAQSGGKFVLESTHGVGTTATLWLPLAPLDALMGESEVELEVAVNNDTQPLLVLAVDDDQLVLTGTVSMLEDLGHKVLPASSAREALKIVRENSAIELVVSDHVMPEMTGAELFELLREERPALPMILATGFAELPPGLSVFASKLAKPFDQSQLADAIARAARVREWVLNARPN